MDTWFEIGKIAITAFAVLAFFYCYEKLRNLR